MAFRLTFNFCSLLSFTTGDGKSLNLFSLRLSDSNSNSIAKLPGSFLRALPPRSSTLRHFNKPKSSGKEDSLFACKSRTMISPRSFNRPPPLIDESLLSCSSSVVFRNTRHFEKTPDGTSDREHSDKSKTGSGFSWAR
uniref:Putative secreted protein n=1 Tax=Ixodes ricinus TaxID=34613 RepID=A0A6B0USL2_IXORI